MSGGARVRVVGALALTCALIAVTTPATAAPPSSTIAPVPADTLGLYDPVTAMWYLRDPAGTTYGFEFGAPGAVPLVGDWDGNGLDSPAHYDPATGRLVRLGDTGSGPRITSFVAEGGLPVVADADGDGRDEVRVITGAEADGPWAGVEGVPDAVDAALAADIDGDGLDDLLVSSNGSWWSAAGSVALPSVRSGHRAVMGDWDGDGVATLAVFRPRNAEFWIYSGASVIAGVTILPIGSSRMIPVAGRFGAPNGESVDPPRIIDIPAMGSGASGEAVVRLQAELAARDLYRGSIDGVYGRATEYAVMAFHKALGRERTWDWKDGDTDLLAGFEPTGIPDRPDEPNRIEVDVGRQVLFLVEDHEVAAIVPVSTGGGYTYFSKRSGRNVGANTPRGDFELLRGTSGWSCDPLYGWCIYKPWNFTDYYAIHGYDSVPAYPASHGCVRIPNWEADALESSYYVGMPVHVWDVMPVIPKPVVIRQVPETV